MRIRYRRCSYVPPSALCEPCSCAWRCHPADVGQSCTAARITPCNHCANDDDGEPSEGVRFGGCDHADDSGCLIQ